MRHILHSILSAAVICACNGPSTDVEAEAHDMLNTARQLMQTQQYHAAKDTILSMRVRYPKAFEARTEGIIVMDSIELLEAQDSLAILDSTLIREQKLLEELQASKDKSIDELRTQQNIKVFNLRQHLDEMGAKVKFFLRKIEIDKTGQQNTATP